MTNKIEEIEKALGVTFQNKDTLRQALVHRSYLNEHPDFPLGHNERLEFLGDAVLELVVTEALYENYENPEGELTNWRAALVNSEMLAKLCRKLAIEEFLHLSKGESKDSDSKARKYILADAFEAMVFGRPYRQRMSVENAIEEIKRQSGSQFDPKITECFLRVVRGKFKKYLKYYH